MKKISLFIAMSLDGYIADSKGSVEWLTGQGNDEDNIDSYSEFVKDIDTVVMGWNTYHQIVTELSPEDWVYDDFTTYVVTHKQKKSSDKIHFVNKNPVELIKELRKENGNGIWICGGANLIQQLVRADIIDCYYITVIPTILGSGIRLFEKADHEIKLRLLKTQSYNGMMDLILVVALVGCSTSKDGNYPATIMVNGTNFYSTNNAVAVEVDDSVIQYTTSYAENGVPKKDGEANFNKDTGTPYAILEDGMVVVLIDNEWIEFQSKVSRKVLV